MDRGTYTIRRSSARFWFVFRLTPEAKVLLGHVTDHSTYTIR